MSTTVSVAASKPALILELEELESLPCGCVSAAYRALPWDVAVVSLEAKGPYCILEVHTAGQILRLGDPFDDELNDPLDE